MKQTSKIVIKKYPNRRLYNTLTSTYIKLEDIASMVKKDEEFAVIDVKTNEDITRLTLVQIILNHETKGYELMPEALIKMMIKFYGHPMSGMAQDFFTQLVQNFNSLTSINSSLDDNSTFNKGLEKIAKTNMEFFNKLFFGANKNLK